MREPEPAVIRDAVRRAYFEPIRMVMLVDEEFVDYGTLAGRSQARAERVGSDSVAAAEAPDVRTDETASRPGADASGQASGEAPAAGEPTLAASAAPASPADRMPAARSEALAALLWQACRARGWVCDVDNGAKIDGAHVPKYVEQCDLLVLDYHLVERDPDRSLSVLRHLSTCSKPSLVVVYTQDPELDRVRREIAAHLRGLHEPQLTPEHIDAVEELEVGLPISDAMVDAYLAGDDAWKKKDAGPARAVLTAANVGQQLHTGIIEKAIVDSLKAYRGRVRETLEPVTMSPTGAARKWVTCGNVFVVCVGKGDREGEGVFTALEEALIAWNPPALFVILAFARHAIRRGGFRADHRTLSAPLHVGWLLHALREESGDGIQTLFGRLLDSIGEGVTKEVVEFGKDLLPRLDPAERGRSLEAPLAAARNAAHLPGGALGQEEVLAALNCFLCSEDVVAGHVHTGTVFVLEEAEGPAPAERLTADPSVQGGVAEAPVRAGAAAPAEPEREFWVCATPACDMVPRDASRRTPPRWSDDVSPMRPMTVVRAAPVPMSRAVLKAENGRHAFFVAGGKPVAVELITETEREPRLEMMFAEDLARLNPEDKTFYVHRIKSVGGVVQLARNRMRALAQMRTPYAARLLQNAGVQQSRMGVDFVAPPAKDAKDI